MPRRAKELSALHVKRLTTPGRHAVGGWGCEGLYLEINPRGTARYWILRNTVGGKRVHMGLGGYPTVSLDEAREKAHAIRKQLRDAPELRLVTPAQERQALAAAAAPQAVITFDKAAEQCHAAKSPEFKNAKHAAQWISTLVTYARPFMGSKPVHEVDTADVLAALQPIWHTKTETATRVRMRIESVLNWSTAKGYRPAGMANPARWTGHLDHLLPKPGKLKQVEHHAALRYQAMPTCMGQLRAKATTSARALEFVVMTGARSSEVRLMTWRELDLAQALWTVPAERMKGRKQHKVPLSAPAVALLTALGEGKPDALVFANGGGQAMSDQTMSKLLKDMGIACVPHGFRSTFKTWAQEQQPGMPDEVSELCLAHVNDDKTRAAYARADMLELRRKLLQEWAVYVAGK